MKFVSTWKFLPGAVPAAAKQFLESGAPAVEGSTILGRWHNADLSGGVVIVETDDPKTAYETAAQWAETIQLSTRPVLEDDEIGPILAKYFG